MASTHTEILKSQYPWAQSPLIVCAPMRLIATCPLANAVTRAGGLGFLGAGTDVSTLSEMLNEASSSFQTSPLSKTPDGILPIGVGFICWGADLSVTLSVIEAAPLKPVAAWLFAPQNPKELLSWTEGIRKASNGRTRIWIQVGTVASGLEVAKSCKPDVLVIQGADAGGHGLVQSSSIITLLPECTDALAREGFGHIPLIATGGIMDGRGVAAALTLGASGVCMGTRFLASPEAVISNGYRNAVVQASDGGVTTARTTVYDKVRGTHGWPESYNARGVLNQSFWDSQEGMSEEENAKLYAEAVKMGDQGWGEKGRMTTYAGTGVGLVKKIMTAGEIVQEVLRDSSKRLAEVSSRL
ncbi:NPD-domain-containing protein [Cadophora sp. DSE1049]|nr:NPD-domain-containing protein [Cadophora sp. DSE1049]